MTTAAIIGGGIGGLSAAIALRDAGLEVQLFDQAPALTELGAGLSLWANATKALTQLGLGPEVRHYAVPLRSLETRVPEGKVLHHADLGPIDRSFGYFSAAMHRGELLQLLLSQVQGSVVVTHSRFQRVSFEDHALAVEFADDRRIEADLVIGADGLFSTVRGGLHPEAVPQYAGYVTWRGIAHVEPPDAWPSMGLVRTIGRGQHFGIGEITPGRYLWYATANRSLEEGEPGGRKETLLRHFGRWHSPIPELIQATPEVDILLHPVHEMPPLDRWSEGRVILLGDAAHPIEPSLGMGACLAIEDALVLGTCLQRAPSAEDAFALYERTRRPRVTSMVRWSRVLARTEQMENPVTSGLRNLGTRLARPSWTQSLARKAFDFSVPGP